MRASRISALLGLFPAVLLGQDNGASGIELSHLRTPTSPAFTLLGVNPSAVARPSTPRALATELVSSTKRGTVIPDSYAAEFAPYWLVPRPAVTFRQYRDKGHTFAQSLSFSLATARPDTGADSLNTQIAIGARALPLGGRASAKFLELDSLMTTVQSASNRIVGPYIRVRNRIAGQRERVAQLFRDSSAAAAAGQTAREAALGIQIDSASSALQRAINDSTSFERQLGQLEDSLSVLSRAMGDEERIGHFMEFATATAIAYRDGTFDSGKFDRIGVWGTYTYRMESPKADLITLLRYVRDLTLEDQDAVELGGRLHWSREGLGISSEFLSRAVIGRVTTTTGPGGTVRTFSLTSSNRFVGIVDYRAAPEMYVTMSFGKDYKELGETRSPLLARFGVQFGYGKKPVVLPSGGDR
jgi:hypothetical protein